MPVLWSQTTLDARSTVLLVALRCCLKSPRLLETVGAVYPRFVLGAKYIAEMTILFDSGIRTGADVFKAIALGAHAVLVGRLYVWGMSHEAETGCRHVMKSLLAVCNRACRVSRCSHAAAGP